jgi:peroxiredoxin
MSLPPDFTAPDVTLTTIDGQSISLAEMLGKGQKILLVFLRHLG